MTAWWRGRPGTVPARLRLLRAAALAAAAAFLAAVVSGGAVAQSAWSDIRDHSAPQVTSATGLYFTLNDMDAQVANELMLGDSPELASHRADAARIYGQRRAEAGTYLRDLAEAAHGDAAAEKNVASAISDLGSYEELASRALLLGEQAGKPAGSASPGPVAAYRSATDLMRNRLLPEVDQLVNSNDRAFQYTYGDAVDGLSGTRIALIGIGVLLLAVLIGLQLFLTSRFNRVINPLTALGTVVIAAVLITGLVHLSDQREKLRLARHDAFDSVVALTRARAISFDANADESRYLLDRPYAADHELDYFSKSQQLMHVQATGAGDYADAVAHSREAYAADHRDLAFTGYFGDELRNITFKGEREAAELVLARYDDYQRDDRKIRALASGGKVADAIAYCTSYGAGGSNADFGRYDDALRKLIAINTQVYERTSAQGADTAMSVPLGLAGGVIAAAALTVGGVRPRLAEFR